MTRDTSGIVGIVGAGVTGRVVAARLHARDWRIAVCDTSRPDAAHGLAGQYHGAAVASAHELAPANVVVVCAPAPHAPVVARLLRDGASTVVSVSDDLGDTDELLALDELARGCGSSVVVGAGMSPGLSGLLAAALAMQMHTVEEIHVAAHGTGGRACARQHHDALARTGVAWHDGAWLDRVGGSGRELCWFPEPVGARDCYRAELAEPRLLLRCFPDALRLSARVSATRRDRLTARLPMLAPPRSGGDIGATRVEVRGAAADGARVTVVEGAAGRVGDVAGSVAAAVAVSALLGRVPHGVSTPGDAHLDNAAILADVQAMGVVLQEFTGVARPA